LAKGFVSAEVVRHLYAVCASGVTGLKRGQEWLDSDVEGKIVKFLTGRGLEIHFVGRP